MQRRQLQIPPKLIPVFQGKARYRGAYGGRGSAKTFNFAKMTAVIGYQLGRAGISGVILCGREHLNSLEESSMEEVKAAIRSEPFLDAYYEIGEKFIRSRDRRISYVFTGLRHNLDGIKSKARILLAWIDEAEQVSEAAWRKLIPTVRWEDPQGRFQSEIWVTWNPENKDSATNQRFIENPPAGAKIIKMNWTDNPWFPEVLNQERLLDQQFRQDTYSHVWEGEYLTMTDALIFAGKYEMAAFEPQADWHGPYNGLDFGFANDPTAATNSFIHDDILYIRRELYALKLEIDRTGPALAAAVPRSSMHALRADNARPETISYMKQNGFPRITAVKKGRGSVEDGIEYLKSFKKIVIHPECPMTFREFGRYSYKVDRLSGDILPIPVDADNHAIDSLRYGHEPMIRFRSTPKVRVL